MSVYSEIAEERVRQIEKEGFNTQHDDNHDCSELAQAAACYCLSVTSRHWQVESTQLWPWESKWWKPKDARRNLVIAAALIVAEIERIDRETSPRGSK